MNAVSQIETIDVMFVDGEARFDICRAAVRPVRDDRDVVVELELLYIAPTLVVLREEHDSAIRSHIGGTGGCDDIRLHTATQFDRFCRLIVDRVTRLDG